MSTAFHAALLLAAVLASGPALQSADAAGRECRAVSGIVSGNVQKVGFRALIFKQAIEYNLAGSAQNTKKGTVQFNLQGDEHRIDQALEAIRNGTKKSSHVKVSTFPAKVDPNLNKFTVIGWTSVSRNITRPYDLAFPLRANDEAISKKDAKEVWHEILRSNLTAEDLNKVGDEDE